MTEPPLTLELLTTVLGWCLVFNLGMMIFIAAMVRAAPKMLRTTQRLWFPDLGDRDIDLVVYGYMAVFKIFVVIFNLVPYLALRIVL